VRLEKTLAVVPAKAGTTERSLGIAPHRRSGILTPPFTHSLVTMALIARDIGLCAPAPIRVAG
jgi:hypothetical protein